MFDPSKTYDDNLSAMVGPDYYRQLALKMGGNSSDPWNNAITGLRTSYESGNRQDPAFQQQWQNQVAQTFGQPPQAQSAMPQPNLGMGAMGAPQPGAMNYGQPGGAQAPQSAPQAPTQSNPYLQAQAGQISQGLTDNLQQRVLPGINSNAIMAGGFGGSRQGIAQGLAIGQNQRAIGDAQTNLYSNAYNTDRNLQSQQQMAQMQNQTQRDLGFGGLNNQRYGMDQNFNLGLGQLGLGAQTANQNFYTNQRGQDLSAMGLGANLVNSGNTGLTNQGSQLWQTGQNEMNAPYNPLNQFGSLLGQFSGLNKTTTDSTPGASTIGSAMGGAISLAQLWEFLNKKG